MMNSPANDNDARSRSIASAELGFGLPGGLTIYSRWLP
jgi:hypothetical protein